MKKEIQIQPSFVKTKNVRNFNVLMDGMELLAGEGCLGAASGRAGLGKTKTSTIYAATNGCVYMQVLRIYVNSEMEFLRGICRALELKSSFGRKGDAFLAAAGEIERRKRPLIIDEADLLPQWGIEIARDLTKMARAHVVLIGEEELIPMMQRNRRVWSRTFQFMEFVPMDATDIMIYAKEATGLTFTPDVASVFLEESGGDFRLVKRDIVKLVQYANAAGTDKVDVKMARIAVKKGLKG
ncbi:MAG: AAA family ATPase [Thermodesulfobacteriota bacterium]